MRHLRGTELPDSFFQLNHDMIEIWKDIPGYEGFYQASCWGRIKSLSRRVYKGRGFGGVPGWRIQQGRILKQRSDKNGYLMVTLSRKGKVSSHKVHRLVLLSFVGIPAAGMEACHFPDKDVTNNRIDNLRWGSRKENCQDQIPHGTVRRGSKIEQSKLDEKDVREIRKRVNQGEKQSEIAQRFGVSRANICLIVKGRTWRHV